MKKISALLVLVSLSLSVFPGNVEKTFHINCSVKNLGQYQTVMIDKAVQSGLPGEPSLPYLAVSMLLPPGESAESIEIVGANEVILPDTYTLLPKQDVVPMSTKKSRGFIKNEAVYQLNGNYPATAYGHLLTQYLNGFAFALSTFTPVTYNPSTGKVSYFKDLTVKIKTRYDTKSVTAMQNITSSKDALNRVRSFAQNPELMSQYSVSSKKGSTYQMLIITPFAFEDGFNALINYYATIGLIAQIVSYEDIVAGSAGIDPQEKIRNYIHQEYLNNGIEYVLLGGTEQIIPSRKFYCVVNFGNGGGVEEEDYGIPADLYYSALDGTDDLNGNLIYGEVADSTDLLPDVAVGRLPFATAAEEASMIHKTVSYQANPVPGEANRPLFVGEYLYDTPITLGGSYMDLLADNHDDNGYFSFGFPSVANQITKLYDTLTGPLGSTDHWEWSTTQLLALINQGTSFIHHLGHANTSYMLRFDISQITDTNFYLVNGVNHNYSLLYTQGCYDGSFDLPDCIAAQSLAIDNFNVAGIFNTRYGWFDQGTTDGPSEHLQREFVSAIFNDTLPESHIGNVLMISKIKTAPFIGLPGEFEPGAQRWSQYDNTLLGDPALLIRTAGQVDAIPVKYSSLYFSFYPNPTHGTLNISYSLPETSDVTFQIINTTGQQLGKDISLKDETIGNHQFAIDLGNLSSGIYYLRMVTGKTTQTKKLVVIK